MVSFSVMTGNISRRVNYLCREAMKRPLSAVFNFRMGQIKFDKINNISSTPESSLMLICSQSLLTPFALCVSILNGITVSDEECCGMFKCIVILNTLLILAPGHTWV